MVLTNCTVTANELTFADVTIEYLENDNEITVHIGDNEEAVIRIYSYFNQNISNAHLTILGTNENNEKHLYELRNPTELRISDGPIVSIGFKKSHL